MNIQERYFGLPATCNASKDSTANCRFVNTCRVRVILGLRCLCAFRRRNYGFLMICVLIESLNRYLSRKGFKLKRTNSSNFTNIREPGSTTTALRETETRRSEICKGR